LQTRIIEEEEEEESAAIKDQKLTVSNVLKTLELFLKDMVMTRRRRSRRRMMQRIESLLLLRRSLETWFPQLGPGRRRPRNGSVASDLAMGNMWWRFGWQRRNCWGSIKSP
jgi:hypothetical protein